MSNNSVRTVVVFGVIALILGAVVVGGVRLTKTRNNSYATSHSSNVAQTNAAKQPASQPQQQKSISTSTSQPSSSSVQNNTNQPRSNPAQSQTPAPAAPSPQPTSSSEDKTNAAASPQQNTLPGTSALSLSDFGFTMILMVLAAFFGTKLLRARADYRRYIGL